MNEGICHTSKGVATKMASETIVAENQAYKQMSGGVREGDDLLTIKDMGTARGTRQIDPGISFHPVYVNSHTQNSCVVSIANCRTKNTAIPEGE